MTSATARMIRTEAVLYTREPLALFWMIGFPTILLAVLGLIPSFRETSADLGGQSVIQLYVPVVVLLSMIVAGAQSVPEFLIGYRQRKVLRRLRTTPVGPTTLLGAQVVTHAAAIMVATVLCLAVGRIAYDVPLPSAPFAYVVTYLLALAAMLAVGALITALSPTTAVGNVLGMVVMFSFMFTAGVWIPVQTMPDVLQTIVHFSPMGAGAEALNQATIGEFPDLAYLGTMAAWALALGLVAVKRFRWE